MMKVGIDLIFDEKKGKERKISYDDVECDGDEWVDASRYMPADFDIMNLKVKNRERIMPGWANGKKWDGLNLTPENLVLYWQRQK